jgi:uncharacterized protein (TIGR02996 family)
VTNAAAFEAKIDENPDDEAPRLVYSDWLIEQGDQEGSDRQRQLVTLRARITAYVAHVQGRVNRDFADRYSALTPPTIEAEFISAKWCRISKVERTGGRSAYCFVCLKDYETKALGVVRAGDVHKPDGWKRPARHARGSVFAEDFGNCSGTHGVAYLR